jgi:hypothetical protein
VLKDNFLINVATYYILVNISESEDSKEEPILSLKVFGGPKNAALFSFNPQKQRYAIMGRL